MKSARELYVEAAAQVATGRGEPGALAALAKQAAAEEMEARRKRLRETWTEWNAPGVSHITAKWTQRVLGDDGLPEEQRIEAACSACGAVYRRGCTSGLVKSHVIRFATVHLKCKVEGP